MQTVAPSSLSQDIARLKREIELLEQQLEAKRAVHRQLQDELDLARRFPDGSGFTRR